MRLLLIALGALVGGLLLSVALSGPARADSLDADPSAPAAAPSTGTSLLGVVTGALSDVTRTVLAPVDTLVATVTPEAAASPRPGHATPGQAMPGRAALPVPGATETPSASAAVDGILDAAPPASAPLWQAVIGPQPVHTLVAPVADALRPLLPGLAELLSPEPGALTTPTAPVAMPVTSPSAAAAPDASAGSASPRRVDASRPGTGPAGALRHPDAPPAPPSRAPASSGADGAVIASSAAGATAPALIAGLLVFALLVLAAARHGGWMLPASPVFATDSSPD